MVTKFNFYIISHQRYGNAYLDVDVFPLSLSRHISKKLNRTNYYKVAYVLL